MGRKWRNSRLSWYDRRTPKLPFLTPQTPPDPHPGDPPDPPPEGGPGGVPGGVPGGGKFRGGGNSAPGGPGRGGRPGGSRRGSRNPPGGGPPNIYFPYGWPFLGGEPPGGPRGGPRGAHFLWYLITLPVGTKWDKMGKSVFFTFWDKMATGGSDPPFRGGSRGGRMTSMRFMSGVGGYPPMVVILAGLHPAAVYSPGGWVGRKF